MLQLVAKALIIFFTYDHVINILKATGDSDAKYQNDVTKAPIAHDIVDYAEKALNVALQTVRNYSVRVSVLEKLSDNIDSLIIALNELDPNNVTQVKDLADDVIKHRDAMVNYLDKYTSQASDSFSEWVKSTGMTFNQLVQRYQGELGYQGDFGNLPDDQKLEVYERIIRMSGKGSVITTDFKSVGGVAFLLILAAMMVWDIFSSNHPFETGVREAVWYATSVGTALVGQVVQTATAFVLNLTVDWSAAAITVFSFAAGVLTSFGGALIIAAITGPLIDAFFGSGGAPLSTDGITCQVADMPDGAILANQIWSQDNAAKP